MVLYNVTVQVDKDIQEQWLQFIREIIAPKMLATDYFLSYRISKMMFVPENDGFTYSIQYTSPSLKHIHQYEIEDASKIRQMHTNKFGEKALVYRSMMEVISEG